MSTKSSARQRVTLTTIARNAVRNIVDAYTGPQKWESVFMGLAFAWFGMSVHWRNPSTTDFAVVALSGIWCMVSAACALKRCSAEGETVTGPIIVLGAGLMFYVAASSYGIAGTFLSL
ncbi:MULTISPECIES: hypothetical protein [unclassified Acetobacter]|uniref:hypothetical protein n=1 Tax=unclassified Acetobacter TaxID=2628570 RepID=UPI0025C61DFB|nr:hypothetical protein [Acetobacter sp. UBA5411]